MQNTISKKGRGEHLNWTVQRLNFTGIAEFDFIGVVTCPRIGVIKQSLQRKKEESDSQDGIKTKREREE